MRKKTNAFQKTIAFIIKTAKMNSVKPQLETDDVKCSQGGNHRTTE
jgi:hypothetical protein